MQELVRIIINKKCIIGFCVLFILNGWLYYHYYEENYRWNANAEYEEWISKYENMDYETALSESEKILETSDDAEALGMVNSQLSYIVGYSDYLQYVEKNADKMKSLAAFQSNEGFAEKNIEKTVTDFKKLQDLELKLDKENAMTAFADNGNGLLFLLVSPLPVLLVFFEERKKGLWQFVYATSGGRKTLAAKRSLILFLYTSVAVLFLELQRIFIIRKLVGDFGDLSRAVQSNSAFSECVMKISMREYMLITIFVKILICTCIAMIMWILSLVVKNSLGTVIIISLLLFAEYRAYMDIEIGSRYQEFKFVNIFSFLNGTNVLTTYQNINIGNRAVGVWEVMLWGIPILFIMLSALMIFLGGRRPFSVGENIIGKVIQRLEFIIKPYKHTVLIFHEGHKIYVKQYVFAVLVALILLVTAICKPKEIHYDYANTIYNSYMEQIQGVYCIEKYEYLQQESEVWENKIADSENKIAEYEKRLSSGDGSETDIFSSNREYEKEQKKIAQYTCARDVVDELLTYSEYLAEIQKQGNHSGYINKIGYERFIGVKGEKMMDITSLAIIMILVFSLSAVGCFESSQNANKFVYSTKRGRIPVFYRKSMHMLMFTFCVVCIISIAQFQYLKSTYGMTGYNYSVHCISGMEAFPIEISVGAMLSLIVIGRMMSAWCCAMLVYVISERCKNILTAQFVAAVLLVVPAAIVCTGVDMASYFSLIKIMGVTYFWNKYGFDNILWILPVLLTALIGILIWNGERHGKKSGV